jgi:hypothetical protein
MEYPSCPIRPSDVVLARVTDLLARTRNLTSQVC